MSADDLARRLVESPRWKRTAPPQWYSGRESRDYDGFLWARAGYGGAWLPALSHDDPATEGCLLRLLEEAVERLGDETEVRVWGRDVELRHFLPARGSSRLHLAFDGPSRGENLANAILTVEHAILAAPGVDDA